MKPLKISIACWPVVAFSVCGIAAAQSSADWKVTEGFPGIQPFSNAYAVTTWDPDGNGPKAPRLVVGGAFQNIADRVVDVVAGFNPEAGRLGNLRCRVEMLET